MNILYYRKIALESLSWKLKTTKLQVICSKIDTQITSSNYQTTKVSTGHYTAFNQDKYFGVSPKATAKMKTGKWYKS